eukprot:COSAG02_NODE_44_length_45948_cov_81.673493_2_plen_129_part_00
MLANAPGTLRATGVILHQAHKGPQFCYEYIVFGSGGIEYVGFSLLSAGIFRGPRSREHVLRLGLEAIMECTYVGLRRSGGGSTMYCILVRQVTCNQTNYMSVFRDEPCDGCQQRRATAPYNIRFIPLS